MTETGQHLCACGWEGDDIRVHLGELGTPIPSGHYRKAREEFCSACGQFGHTAAGVVRWPATKLCDIAKAAS